MEQNNQKGCGVGAFFVIIIGITLIFIFRDTQIQIISAIAMLYNLINIKVIDIIELILLILIYKRVKKININ